jgi:hypothetical protein
VSPTPSRPYAAACASATTEVALSGTASADPERMPLIFRWSSPDGLTFDDPMSPTPTATAAGTGSFRLDLEVSDGFNPVTCATTIDIAGAGTPPPELSRGATPLWLVKRGGDTLFSFEDLGGAPLTYNFYVGTIRDIWSHEPLACTLSGMPSTPGRREALVPAEMDSRYFLVTAASCGGEGDSGADPARSTCPP